MKIIIRSLPGKLASMLTVLAVALTLAAGLGVTTVSPAYAATTYLIDGTPGHTWADLAPGPAYNLNLFDGDVLNITTSAGQPGNDTQIQVGAGASATINGNGSLYNNVHIQSTTVSS